MQATVNEPRPRVPERAPGSAPVRMSERYWNIRWPEWRHGGITAELVAIDAVTPFISQHYAAMFPSEPNRFFTEQLTETKLRYLAEADCFLFRADGRQVGVCIAHPTDWATYYIRTMAILPEYRGRSFTAEFLHHLWGILPTVGVTRFEAETAPTNIPVNRLLTGLGLAITGTTTTERWGTLVRYTKFLDAEAEQCFRRQFVITPASVPERSMVSKQQEGETQ